MDSAREILRFTLPEKYYQLHRSTSGSGMPRDKMIPVLMDCFSMTRCEVESLMNNNSQGAFDVICTPAQFGRFIVQRHDIGTGVNGIKDLRPRLHHKRVSHCLVDVADRCHIDGC